MTYNAQFAPGETKIAENRRKHMNPDHQLKTIREVSDEGLVRSREAFIVNDGLDVDAVAKELYKRLEKEIHFKSIPEAVFEEIKRGDTEERIREHYLEDR